MTEQLSIVCPECGFRKDVPKNQIPEGATQASCPKCRQSFLLNGVTLADSPSPVTGQPTPPRLSLLPPEAFSPIPHADTKPRLLTFSFTGSARDYFGIWVLNTLLKLLTAGIYSAWAKVRKRRFFYGSTTLHDQPFEYTADPIALFKGWLIAAVAFLLYALGTRVSPLLSAAVGLIIFAVFPWLLVRSRMFNASNSSHRNIRFSFRPEYSQAYLVYAALPLVSMLTLGLLTPYTLFRQRKFLIENSSYGATPFVFTAKVEQFYKLALKIVLTVVGVLALIVALVALSGVGLSAADIKHGSLKGMAFVPMISFLLVYFIIIVYAQTAMANICWNGTSLAGSRFQSNLRTRDMALLFVTNALAILFSFGLLMPWAAVRQTRYRFDRLALWTDSGLDSIVAAADSGQGVSATGEEIGDVFGMTMDISL